MSKRIVGVMGPGLDVSEEVLETAFSLGKAIAEEGWLVLSGGSASGVMDAVSKGAKSAGGLSIGILPGKDLKLASSAVDIPIVTGMGSARNNINVLSSDVVVACGMGRGTASEVALALKAKKHVILLQSPPLADAFFKELAPEEVHLATSVAEVIEQCRLHFK